MKAYNFFGTDITRVLDFYPETVLADYGGTEAITEELNRATKRVAGALTPVIFQKMTEPELELIVRRAANGQTTAQLGLFPLVAASLRVWVISQGAIRPSGNIPKPMPGVAEAAGFSVNAATGAITGLPALAINDQVYASYQVDVNNAAFNLDSLGEFVALGTAWNMGPKLYAQGSDTFELVKQYGERFTKQLELAMKGEWIPDELRIMRWWDEAERSSTGISSIDLPRG